MAQCRWCDKKGLFLSVDSNGLCRDCQPLIIEVESKARVLIDSMRLAHEGKTFGTRLSRCDLTIEHGEYLSKFEHKGVRTVSPSPSVILTEYRALRTELIIEEANTVADKAFGKCSVASTPSAKERALAAGILKVREVTESLGSAGDVVELLE